MKKLFGILIIFGVLFTLVSCEPTTTKPDADKELQRQTEELMQESNYELGMPAIVNFQEKKNLKWIYELCDQEEFICHAYIVNQMTGDIGRYLGECIGYGIPYSTQYSNPEKLYHDWKGDWKGNGASAVFTQQAEPNGLFKASGMSATWLIMIDPETKEPRPVYVEPEIIVSPFKLHK